MNANKKTALCVAIAVTLSACGGGGGDDTQATPTPSFEMPKSTALQVNALVQENIKNLAADWNSKTTVLSNTQLSFAGVPNLLKGDVFVLNNKAYKVESVAGGTAGSTIVTVSEPALNEIYKKIELSGKMDAAEFILNPDLEPVAPVAVAKSAMTTATTKSSTNDTKTKLTVNANEDGFYTMTYDVTKKFTPTLEGKGQLKLGSKSDFSKNYDLISNTGSGKIEFYLSAEALLSLKKGGEYDQTYENDVCRSGSNSTGRILLGTIPLAKVIGKIPGAQVVELTTDINIPVCLVANAKTSMSYDLINLSGKLSSTIVFEGGQSPKINNIPSLTVTIPPSTAKLADDATVLSLTGKKQFKVEAKAEAGIEFGIEAGDKLGAFTAGASVAVLGKPSLTGTFGGEAISKNFSSLDTEPTVCLELNSKVEVRALGFTDSWLNKKPLTVVATLPIGEPITKKWGLGQCEEKPKTCPTGQELVNGACQDKPKTCPTGQALVNGICTSPSGSQIILEQVSCESVDNSTLQSPVSSPDPSDYHLGGNNLKSHPMLTVKGAVSIGSTASQPAFFQVIASREKLNITALNQLLSYGSQFDLNQYIQNKQVSVPMQCKYFVNINNCGFSSLGGSFDVGLESSSIQDKTDVLNSMQNNIGLFKTDTSLWIYPVIYKLGSTVDVVKFEERNVVCPAYVKK